MPALPTRFPPVLAAQLLPSHVGSAEQSNTSIIYGKQLFLKIYRRLQPEENPDVEVGRFLTEVAHFNRIPPFLGEISINSASAVKTTVALLQGLVPNQGDGWQWFLDELANWLTWLVATLGACAFDRCELVKQARRDP